MAFWRSVDWQRPWLAPYRAQGEAASKQLEAGDSVADALNHQVESLADAPRLAAGTLRFVDAASLPAGEAYESFIHRRAQVPTRDNLHDLFNGVVWLVQPALKRRLNELHAAEIDRIGVAPQRGPVRDALTLFDENGALWQAPAVLVDALERRDWHTLFVTQRRAWVHARLQLIGHALLEKLVQPRKPITAHLLLCPAKEAMWPSAWPLFTASGLAAKPFLSMPVLGVPLWWPANEEPAFYDDSAVFRPRTR